MRLATLLLCAAVVALPAGLTSGWKTDAVAVDGLSAEWPALQAIERGPLVYCLEGVDHPGGGLDDIVLDTTRPLAVKHRPDLLGGVTTVVAAGRRRTIGDPGWWPYANAGGADPGHSDEPVELTAVPYYAWANRQDSSMRVWIPTL